MPLGQLSSSADSLDNTIVMNMTGFLHLLTEELIRSFPSMIRFTDNRFKLASEGSLLSQYNWPQYNNERATFPCLQGAGLCRVHAPSVAHIIFHSQQHLSCAGYFEDVSGVADQSVTCHYRQLPLCHHRQLLVICHLPACQAYLHEGSYRWVKSSNSLDPLSTMPGW